MYYVVRLSEVKGIRIGVEADSVEEAARLFENMYYRGIVDTEGNIYDVTVDECEEFEELDDAELVTDVCFTKEEIKEAMNERN